MSSRSSAAEGVAVIAREAGDADVLELVPCASRAPSRGEVRVAVRAAGLNRADVLQRRGLYPAPEGDSRVLLDRGAPRDVLGLEFAGVVDAVGEGVTEVAVGARVMGIVGGGAMASHVLTHARTLLPIPEGLGFAEAAAIPEAFLTAWDALHAQGSLVSGDVLLVHAAASGVGTAAIQLARACSASVVATSRSEEKLARLEALGLLGASDASGLVVASPPSFAEDVCARTGGRGADVILDTVGASYLEENVRALARGGTIVTIGLLGGARGTLSLGALLQKRARVLGSVLRSRPLEEKITLARSFAREALPLFATGRLRPIVDRALPLEAVREAHRAMERGENVGKIVLLLG